MNAELKPGYVIPVRLLAVIDHYKREHGGVSDASIARAVDISPQAISTWRTRGLKKSPSLETLRALAAFMNVREQLVIRAVLYDIGWLEEGPEDPEDETGAS